MSRKVIIALDVSWLSTARDTFSQQRHIYLTSKCKLSFEFIIFRSPHILSIDVLYKSIVVNVFKTLLSAAREHESISL